MVGREGGEGKRVGSASARTLPTPLGADGCAHVLLLVGTAGLAGGFNPHHCWPLEAQRVPPGAALPTTLPLQHCLCQRHLPVQQPPPSPAAEAPGSSGRALRESSRGPQMGETPPAQPNPAALPCQSAAWASKRQRLWHAVAMANDTLAFPLRMHARSHPWVLLAMGNSPIAEPAPPGEMPACVGTATRARQPRCLAASGDAGSWNKPFL